MHINVVGIKAFFALLICGAFVVGCQESSVEQSQDVTSLKVALTQVKATGYDPLQDSLSTQINALVDPLERLESLYQHSSAPFERTSEITRLRQEKKQGNSNAYLGMSYYLLGQYFSDHAQVDSAFYNYQKANYFYRKLEDPVLIQKTLIAQALALYTGQLYTLAQAYILKSAQWEAKQSLPIHTFEQQYIYGASFIGLKQYELGVDKLDRAMQTLLSLELSPAFSAHDLQHRKLSVLAQQIKGYIGLGLYEKALKIIEQTLTRYNLAHAPALAGHYAEFLQLKASVAIAQNDVTHTRQELAIAKQIYIQIKDHTQELQSDLLLAQVLIGGDSLEQAHRVLLQTHAKALQYNEVIAQKNALGILLGSVILDQRQSSVYFQEYQQLSELIYDQELQKENTFAKVALDTDRLISSNVLLSSQKDRFKNIALFCGIGAIIAGLGVVLTLLRQKTKKLQMHALFQKDSQMFYDTILNRESEIASARFFERKNIASELHDGVLNKMFVTRFLLQQITPVSLEKQKPVLLNELVEVEQYLRDLSHTLSKQEEFKLEQFYDLLMDLIEVQNRNTNTLFTLEVGSGVALQNLSHEHKVHLYRIVQEAVQNVHKHAKASLCLVKISKLKANGLHLSIWDNGVGFAVKKTSFGLGLSNIKRRSELLNANFSVKSSEKGTTLLCLYLHRL